MQYTSFQCRLINTKLTTEFSDSRYWKCAAARGSLKTNQCLYCIWQADAIAVTYFSSKLKVRESGKHWITLQEIDLSVIFLLPNITHPRKIVNFVKKEEGMIYKVTNPWFMKTKRLSFLHNDILFLRQLVE